MPTAQRAALDYAKEQGTFVAPMTLLLRNFPHGNWYTANSEEHYGIDADGQFGPKGGHVVVTLHGGREGIGLLTPDIIELAYDMKRAEKGGMNEVYAAVLSDVYADKNVFADLLHGGLPNGESILVLPHVRLKNEGAPANFQRYASVRTLDLARQTDSGYKPIKRLTDKKGKITDSQVIAYAGGVPEGQRVIDNSKKAGYENLGVWHPFNRADFNPDVAHGRVLFVGYIDYDGLNGDYYLDNYGRFVGVKAAKPQVVREKLGKGNLVKPTLEEVLAVTAPFTAEMNQDALRKALGRLYQK